MTSPGETGDASSTAARPLGAGHPDGPLGKHHEWRLPSSELSLRSLRRDLRAILDGSGLPADERDDLLLAVSEAASNAIEHAVEPSETFFDVLSDVRDGEVTVTVRDYGQWEHAPTGPHRGRGLAMMGRLADTTIFPRSSGTTVTMRSRPNGGPLSGEPFWG
jgi:anti-sigma regulatory factor (Ser/Thr protein kinase)